MRGGKCRACGAASVTVLATRQRIRQTAISLGIRSPGQRRSSEFEICARCAGLCASGELPAAVRDALLAEFKTLL